MVVVSLVSNGGKAIWDCLVPWQTERGREAVQFFFHTLNHNIESIKSAFFLKTILSFFNI